MVTGMLALFLAPIIVSATSVEYYRSASCDAQSSRFFLDKYTVVKPLSNERTCHQTPARTTAVKLMDGIDPACVVLAYDDYACTDLVGSVPTNGKCVAATNAKIGSWEIRCDATTNTSPTPPTTYVPGDLKRRGKQRVPSIRDVSNTTTSASVSCTVTVTLVPSSIASDMSSAVNASAGAALSSASLPGTAIESNFTSYATTAVNSSYVLPTMMTIKPSSTAISTDTRSSNGTAIRYAGGSASSHPDGRRIMVTALCGAMAIVVAVMV